MKSSQRLVKKKKMQKVATMTTKKTQEAPKKAAPVAKKSLQPILNVAQQVYDKIDAKQAPQLSMPLRSLQNVKYDEKAGYFELEIFDF